MKFLVENSANSGRGVVLSVASGVQILVTAAFEALEVDE